MRQKTAGFTLIEVLVAMTTFAIAAAATASLMFHSTAAIGRNSEGSQAITIAQQVIEDLRAADYSDMESGSASFDWKGQTGFFAANWDVSEDEPEPGMKTIVVSVQWEHKGETKTYETQSVYTDIDA